MNYFCHETPAKVVKKNTAGTAAVLDTGRALPGLQRALIEADLGKYWTNFDSRNCDITVFLTLSEDDLKKNYDIKLFGPRRKLSILIKQLRVAYETLSKKQ